MGWRQYVLVLWKGLSGVHNYKSIHDRSLRCDRLGQCAKNARRDSPQRGWFGDRHEIRLSRARVKHWPAWPVERPASADASLTEEGLTRLVNGSAPSAIAAIFFSGNIQRRRAQAMIRLPGYRGCGNWRMPLAVLPQLSRTLLKVVIPLIAIAAVFLIARRRRLLLQSDLGIRPAPVGETIIFLLLYGGWMLTTDALTGWRGPWDFTIWRQSPVWVDVLRVVAVGILGPIAEELIFRGLLYAFLIRTRLRVIGTIVVLAAVWAGIHIDYSALVIGILFIAGVLLGAARFRTGSVLAPILMHILWNLYAVW
jgi:membrane protease YdiL (CAAX protease family)